MPSPSTTTGTTTVHVFGPRPTTGQFLGELRDVVVTVPLSLVVNEFGDVPMMRRMLLNLKQRAEGASR